MHMLTCGGREIRVVLMIVVPLDGGMMAEEVPEVPVRPPYRCAAIACNTSLPKFGLYLLKCYVQPTTGADNTLPI